MIQAKKSLGQHFLTDENVAQNILSAFLKGNPCNYFLEIGPGMGVLTKYLIKLKGKLLFVVETDSRMIEYLNNNLPMQFGSTFHDDFLKFDFNKLPQESLAVIGNFPYNISSQILFRVLENKKMIPLMVGMFQKEVAVRIASSEGNKNYGILSVLIQAFYKVELLFEVNPGCFTPPPKVQSSVIRLTRLESPEKIADEKFFFTLVKAGFNQRRKMLRNSLSGIINEDKLLSNEIYNKRAEALSVSEWIKLSNNLFQAKQLWQ